MIKNPKRSNSEAAARQPLDFIVFNNDQHYEDSGCNCTKCTVLMGLMLVNNAAVEMPVF
jgi:hypothetical protein